MKTKFRISALFMMAAMLCSVAIISCKDDDGGDTTPATDFTTLNASISTAEARLANSEEGRNDGQYSAAARTSLQTAITAAKAVVSATGTTQAMADAANTSLTAAITAYDAAEIQPIAAEALVAHWSFDEGTGTTAKDYSGNGFDGTLKLSPKWKTAEGKPENVPGLPEWAADRTGAAGKAIHFDKIKSGNIEVPYNAKLNPTGAITVSVWLKSDSVYENNRFLGLQSWVGYKFQLQNVNRPFFTYTNSAGQAYNEESPQNLPLDEWFHVVVTYGNSVMTFYVDGEVTATINDRPGPMNSIAGKPYNLTIGQDFPTDKYAAEECWPCFDDSSDPNYHVIPMTAGGHFIGSLDEMRIYNVALTAAQVTSLYEREKP